MILDPGGVLEQSFLVTDINSSSLGIVMNLSSVDILSDINLMVDILSVVDFLKADIGISFTFFSWGFINIVINRWAAQLGLPRQFLSGGWRCCWPPPPRFVFKMTCKYVVL